ncbi:ATP-binding protein [Hydrogenophaga sp.]|uniref:AAA family ATPase n=1 Tax=Hydrogenophaga sp. TaxID=1904254 RepID=UPI002601C340|nr:ATP-binding protein [Hydrogenophaga sp.]MCW5654143.1 AAA family ATPase [Hydrogenophaga sp.]
MMRIKVEDFSCIKKADLTFGRLTVLIGPQASGKSVLSKLAYFFLDLISEQYERLLEQKSFEAFAEDIKGLFSDWFPVAAWGNNKFKIEFELGEYKLRLTRTSYDESIRNNLRLWTSPLVKEHYKRTSELTKSLRQKASRRNSQAHFVDVELGYEVREAATKILQEEIGADFVSYQTFIPAGRSFFTTLGRAFLAFDQGRTLDPVTIQFGRLYSSFQEELRFFSMRRGASQVEEQLGTILGGAIIWEGDRPALKSIDGRIVPFSALSSGQQELLPLVLALSSVARVTSRSRQRSHLLYIEEPEAHLFPSAQSALVQRLAALINGPSSLRRLAITTHSPYVLSKINNLIKAGALATTLRADKLQRLNGLISEVCRINPGDARAYAIVDGVLHDIVDDDGLIAADYLDSISGEIGQEFSNLLDLEFTE